MASKKKFTFVIVTSFSILIGSVCCTAVVSSCSRHPSPRIAVIGAGIGGASATYYLRKLFGDGGLDVTSGSVIDVYEAAADDRVGGRLAVTTVGGQQYESGGSVIHPRNHYMVQFAKLLGLKPRQPSSSRLGLFDGKEYLFVESDWTVANYVKLFWRYGTSMLRLQWFMDDMMDKFSHIYDAQDRGDTFETVDGLLAAMNPLFANMTRMTARSYLRSLDFSERFIDELFMAITRVNYGQTPDLTAFVGAVALAGAQPGLWSIEGGNYQVPKRLLESSRINLIFSKVTTIKLRQDRRFDLHHSKTVTTTYDLVFVCTPLTSDDMSGIAFEGFPKPLSKFAGEYQRTIATFVRGVLNRTELRMKGTVDIDEVLTTTPDVFFNSLGVNHAVVDGVDDDDARSTSKVWKIFSRRRLTDVQLESLYLEVTEKRVVDWLAYPHYDLVHGSHGDFVLYSNLYYTNCIEWAASAMEMSVIAARNVAMLASKQWTQKSMKFD